MASGLNRRQSVRVTDRVMLSCAPIAPEKFKAIAEDYKNGISLYNHEALGDIQMYIGAQSALTRLRERDADLADFLKHMDNKINIVLKRAKGERSPFDDLKLQKVNLSGNGIAFTVEQELAVDDIVELHLVLLPTYTYIYCFAKVVNCEPKQGEQGKQLYRLAVEFILVMDEDQEKLIQHTFKQQSLALRNRRLNS